jgi:glycine oxidase
MASQAMTDGEAQIFDAAVVGGGLIGLAVAHRLRARGLSAVVLDAGEPGAASAVSAGMLAPVSEAAFGEEALLGLNRESAARWPAFAAELGVPLARPGALMVARDRDEAEALQRELAYREELGLPVRHLRPSEARRLEPALAPTLRAALEAPEEAVVDPRDAVGALLSRHLRVRAGARVTEVRPGRGVVLAGGEEVHARHVVVAAGAWSDLPGIPPEARIPVRPVKGQILRLRDPDGPGLVTRILRMAEGYLVPRADGSYVLGATMEEQGFDHRVTAGAVWELLRDAIELVPGLAELELEELGAGLRPGSPDNAPAVGPGAVPGLHWATGHFRHGVLLTPLTADIVAAGVAGDEAAVPPALDPRRFAAPVPS